MRRLVAATGTLALLGAGGLVAADPAVAAARHVGVVVRYANGRVSAGCAAPGGTGLQVLEQHHSVVMGTQQYSGFVLKIDGTGTTRPDNTHYWSYWRSGGGGAWTYSNSGAYSTHPAAGTVEGWSYVNGQSQAPRPPRYTYAALCGHLDPKPKPAAQPTPHPTSAAPSSAQQAPPTRAAQPTQTASSSGYLPPRAPTTAHPARTSVATRTSAGHRAAHHPTAHRSTPAQSPSPVPDPTSTTPAPAQRTMTPLPATEPASAAKSDTGFPAWGTVVAVLVIAGLGGTAWALSRRRAN